MASTDIKTSKAHDALAEVSVTGKFIRTASGFREIISADHPIYKPEFNRYHLYISLACPWANRCLAVLKLKGLDDCIHHTVVHPTWQKTKPGDEEDKHCGWAFFQSGMFGL
jgi:putative glutathione S-transferase